MAAIKLKNVTKQYPDSQVTALSNITFDIHKGEFIVVVGPPGSGKTTLLEVIAGIVPVTAGEISINGQDANKVAPIERDTSMIFQNHALYPHRTIYENLAFELRLHNIPEEHIQSRINYFAEILRIDHLLFTRVVNLSDQERQITALTKAFVSQSSLYLLDQPLTNINEKVRQELRKLILHLHTQNKSTSIYCTEDIQEGMAIADRIIILSEGKVVQIGTPEEIYQQPNSIFVADYMAKFQINLVPCVLNQGVLSTISSIKIPLNPLVSKKLENLGYEGKELIVGIRKEDIHSELVFIDSSIDTCFTSTIQTIELDGSQKILNLLTKDNILLQASVHQREQVKIGDTIELAINRNKLHFFEQSTGKAILQS